MAKDYSAVFRARGLVISLLYAFLILCLTVPGYTQGPEVARGSLDGVLRGKWTYRSFRDNPTAGTPVSDLLFGEGSSVVGTIARSQPPTVGRASTGVTADIIINGRQVSPSHPDVRAFKQKCHAFGVTEVLVPVGPNHAPMFTLASRDRGSVEPPAHRLVVTLQPKTNNH